MAKARTLRFRNMGEDMLNIATALMEHPELGKRLKHIEKDYPLEQDDVRPNELLEKLIRFDNFDEDAILEMQPMIFIAPNRGYYRFKQAITPEIMQIMILVPSEFSYNYNTMEYTSYELARCVMEALDQQEIAGVGKMWLEEYEYMKRTKSHNGWSLYFNVGSASYR